MKKAICLLLLSAAALSAAAQTCTLSPNQPTYGYQTLPFSERQLNIIETGCPTGTVTSASVLGNVLTVNGTGFGSFVVGKKAILQGMPAPFDDALNSVSLTIVTASATGYTAVFTHSDFGLTSVSATAIQASLVNYSVLSTSGTMTASLGCTSNCLPTVLVTTDGTNGACTTTQPSSPSGNYTVVSTQSITVRATSVVDPTKVADTPIRQCAQSTEVHIPGANYYQAFKAQKIHLGSIVYGNVNQAVTWSITTQPSGGNGVLDYTGSRDTMFHATVTGRYVIRATSSADGTKSDTAIVYVSPNNLPAYAATPNKTAPQECYADPALTGTIYRVGPTQAFTTLASVPTNTWTPGSMIIVVNEDVTGGAPTTFHEWVQISTGGTATQPMQMCGLPDGFGNLPVIDAANSHGPTWASTSAPGFGLVSTFISGCFGVSQNGSCGPNYIRFAGLRYVNATAGFSYTAPDGTTIGTWGSGSDGLNIRTGTHISVLGNDFDNDAQGVGTYDNASGYWAPLTMWVDIRNNHFIRNGVNNDGTSHPIYFQSYGGVIDANLFDHPATGNQGSCIKLRGMGEILSFNRCESGYARYLDFVENQDSYQYVTYEGFLGNPGDTSCTAPYCFGDTLGLNRLAALQESLYSGDFVYGNVFNNQPQSAGNLFHYLADHDDNNGNYAMSSRYGKLNFWNNSVAVENSAFDTASQYTLNYFLNARFYIADNIMDTGQAQMAFNAFGNFIGDFHTNLMRTGTANMTLPIYGGRYNSGQYPGWVKSVGPGNFLMASPINAHITGNLTTDFLFTATPPFNATTFRPVSGSMAIGAGVAITGPAAQWRLVNNAVDLSGVVLPRLNPTDLGAMDSGTVGVPGLIRGTGLFRGSGAIQ